MKVHFAEHVTERLGEVLMRARGLCGVRGYEGDANYIVNDESKVTCKVCLSSLNKINAVPLLDSTEPSKLK